MPRKKKPSQMARRYQAVYDKLYDELPKWKKQGIEDKCPRLTAELAKDVANRAERDEDTDLPE